MSANRYDRQNAATKVDGYFLRVGVPQRPLVHDFAKAKEECLAAMATQLEHVRALTFEQFCLETKRLKQAHAEASGGYFVMVNEKSVAHSATLAEARRKGQVICDGEILPGGFSIEDGDGNHIEDIARTDGQGLEQQVASFNAKFSK